jgi:hypothetical protein
MTQEPPKTKQKRSKLKMTHDKMVGVFSYAIDTDGVDKADAFFEQMNKYCSIVPGWSEVAIEVRSIIADAKKKQQEEQFAKELALRKAAAPNILLMNQNEANGMKETKKLINHDVLMTGENAVYNEKNEFKE